MYQPAGIKVTATEIRFSTAINESFKPVDYALELLDYSGTLFKYMVADFAVKPDAVRYYDVVCIFSQVARGAWTKLPQADRRQARYLMPSASVGRRARLTGTSCIVRFATEVVTVTDKRVGYIVYPSGFQWVEFKKCESHYVAFTTDRDIERLMEADLTYVSKPYTYTAT